jgi:hypothetical protein
MDWLQFFASLITSLAWPVTLLAAVFMLRSNIGALFPYIERLKYKDFEVEFRKALEETAEKSRTALHGIEMEAVGIAPRDRLYSLAEISPRSAILEAWLQVETVAAEVLLARDPSFSTKTAMAPLRLGEALNRKEIINGAQLEIFHRLRDLRNKAVHVGDAVFKPDEVAEYISLATALTSQIRRGTYGP